MDFTDTSTDSLASPATTLPISSPGTVAHHNHCSLPSSIGNMSTSMEDEQPGIEHLSPDATHAPDSAPVTTLAISNSGTLTHDNHCSFQSSIGNMSASMEGEQPGMENLNTDATHAPTSAPLKSEDDITPSRPDFSLDFQKFSSIDEALACLEIIRDIACLESRVRKVLPNPAVQKTLDLNLSKSDRNALSRTLSMSPKVLRIAKLIRTPAEREAVREAVRYLNGLARLEDEMAGLPKDEQDELKRAHEWFSKAYKDDGSAV